MRRLSKEKVSWTILGEQFPVPRNKAASKLGVGVILLLWQLLFHCNPDHHKFSSLSNTGVVLVFLTPCNGDIVFAQTWGLLPPKNKPYWATLLIKGWLEKNHQATNINNSYACHATCTYYSSMSWFQKPFFPYCYTNLNS